MKKIINIIYLFSMLCGCTGKGENEEKSTQPEKVVEIDAFLFYKLDDKYSTENDSVKIKEWIKRKYELVKTDRADDNLFKHNGGGPNGSEWNSSTDLFLGVTHPSNSDRLKIFINNESFDSIIYEFENMKWFLIKQDFWEKAIRKIDSDNIEKMYSEEYLKGIKKGDFHPDAELETGKILKIDIKLNEQELTKFFHVSYGE